MEYHYNLDGSAAAVLVSHGFGAGWSTWNDSNLAWDKRVVEYVMEHMEVPDWRDNVGNDSIEHDEMVEFLNSIGYMDAYLGGLRQIAIEWVPVGAHFIIDEYDGNESITYRDDIVWKVIGSNGK